MKSFLLFSWIFLQFNSNILAQDYPNYWSEIQSFKKQDFINPPIKNPILFIGSSSFTKWTDVNDYFPTYPILNRGFGGSTLTDLIRYSYDILINYHPKQVVIYCGENDLAYISTLTATEVFTRFKTLFYIIRINLPNIPIDYISMKPSPSRKNLLPKQNEGNQLIKEFLAHQKNVFFINIYDAMLDKNQKMRPELYLEDSLHMKPMGYHIWAKTILPYLIR